MTEHKRETIYSQVTDRIIAELEEGRLPWVQPWGEAGTPTPLGMPRNASTGKAYSGINILLLWSAAIRDGRTRQDWLTFRQAQALGGHVKKGERGSTVVFADHFIPKAERERAEREADAAVAVPFLKRYTVFNVEQCEGLPKGLAAAPAPRPEHAIVPRAEALIAATGADFRIGGRLAYYMPSRDFIAVPPQVSFFHPIDYYRTCFHELGHWTGHQSRLERDIRTRFGTHAYAREELVAEMASAFVCASLGIVPTVRHADYIGEWLELLREDNRAIFRAASQASKAADFLLAFEQAEADADTAGAAA